MSLVVGRIRAGHVLSMIAVTLLLSVGVNASDWPQYRGPNSDGVSDEEIVSAPAELWTASVGTGYSAVIVSNGRVYATGHVEAGGDRGADTVYCLDAATGQELWTYSYDCRSTKGSFGGLLTELPGDLEVAGPRATPATDGIYVYTLSLDGHLFCLDAATGKVIWYRNIEAHLDGNVKAYGCCSSPLIYDDKLILDVGGACMALNKATGAEAWRRDGGGGWCGVASPVIGTDGPLTFVVFGSQYALGADVTDGSLLWQYNMGREAMTAPVVSGDKVVFSTYPDTGKISRIIISGGSASMDWEKPAIMTYHLTNVLKDDYLYVMDNSGTEWDGHDSGDGDGSGDSSLKCLDFADGSVRWTKTALGWANVIVADDELVILRETGELLRADASSVAYNEIGAYPGVIGQWCWTAPALAEGRIYCRNDKGDVVCLSVTPAVTIEATDAMASEAGPDTGTFTAKRVTTDNTAPITVNIVIGGSEETGEFTLTGGSITATDVTIPGGSDSVDVTVTPLADGDTDDETVIITLQAGTGYVVGSESSAAVQIIDSGTSLPEVTITATGKDAWVLEGGPDTGAFTASRSTSASWPLVVDISLGGTAIPADYSLLGSDGTTVTIPAGQTDAIVTLTALDDAAADGDLLVTMTVTANATYYTVGVPSDATVTIVDDDDVEDDGDSDGMDDGWEQCYWGDTDENGSDDYDGDGLSNAEEYTESTDPTDEDTDNDGSTDGNEVDAGTKPLDPTSFTDDEPEFPRYPICGSCQDAGAAAGTVVVVMLLAFSMVVLRMLSRRWDSQLQ